MALTSLKFAIFMALLTTVYFAFCKTKYQWVMLLIGSYVFYFFAGIKIAAFMMLTTLSTYLAGIYIAHINSACREVLREHKTDWDRGKRKDYKESRKKLGKRAMILTLFLNFGILFLIKYYGFFASNINIALGTEYLPSFKFILPLGISFYTFQSMGYLIDVYREEVEAETNLAKFALFVSFFPQIIQGPISKYSQLAHQLYEQHRPEYRNFKYGLELILWGVFKKIVIADRAAIIIGLIKEAITNNNQNGSLIVLLILLYALQLYADFSGGIDVARGVAQLLGIDMIQNFRQPYFASSLTDYWNRWHISLGAWMRQYIFYPIALSGVAAGITKSILKSSIGKTKTGAHIAKVLPGALASLVVFLVVGIWHGAEWKYIFFGLWNGLVIMISILIAPLMVKSNELMHINPDSKSHKRFRIIRTFILVCIGYYFDVANTATEAFSFLKSSIMNQGLTEAILAIKSFDIYTLIDIFILIVMALLMYVVGKLRESNEGTTLREMMGKRPAAVQWMVLFISIMTLLVIGIYGPGYDPQDFVYMQF